MERDKMGFEASEMIIKMGFNVHILAQLLP